jgi:hypothetical protein
MSVKIADHHDTYGRTLAIGESALTGWRDKAAGAVAKPVAGHSRFSEDEVKAAIGFALLAYAIYRLLRPVVRTIRGRT